MHGCIKLLLLLGAICCPIGVAALWAQPPLDDAAQLQILGQVEELPATDVESAPAIGGATQVGELVGSRTPLELVEFRDIPLGEAVRILTDQSDLKIVPSAEAAQTVVSLYLKDVDAVTALDAMTKANGLYYRQDRTSGIIRIYTTDEYNAAVDSFRDESTEVFTLLYPNPVDVAFALQGLFGTRVQLNFGSIFIGDSMMSQDLQQRFSRFALLSAFNQLATTSSGNGNNGGVGGSIGGGGIGGGGIGGGIGGGGLGGGIGGGGLGGGLGGIGGGGFGGGGFGGGFGGGQLGGALGGFGNVNQQANMMALQAGQASFNEGELTPEQIQQLIGAMQNSDPESKAAVERLLRTRNARIFVTVIRRNNQIAVRTSDERIMEQIRTLITKLDVPTPLVLLEVKVLSLNLGDLFTSVFDYQFTDGSLSGEFTAGNILAPTPAGATSPLNFTTSGAPGPGTAQDLAFQVVSSNFRARLQLLENNNRVTSLATPVILTANNEVSQVFVGQQIPLVTGYNQGAAVNSVGATTVVQPSPQVTLTEVGEGLLLTPNINADRTVTLRVSQQQSDVVANGATFPIVDAQGNAQQLLIDVLNTREVSGTVVAKDGCTVALGGLISETLTDSRAEVPILGKLPVIGYFFRRQSTNRTRTELVVLIRPYVFNTPSESAALSRELMQDLSIHPNSPDGLGTLGAFNPQEVLRASPPDTKLQQIFRFHSLYPKTY